MYDWVEWNKDDLIEELENNTKVLVATRGRQCTLSGAFIRTFQRIIIATYDVYDGKGGFAARSPFCRGSEIVTHWAKLPELPQCE